MGIDHRVRRTNPGPRRARLLGIAAIAFRIAAAGLGAAWLADNTRLQGIAAIAVGIAVAGTGLADKPACTASWPSRSGSRSPDSAPVVFSKMVCEGGFSTTGAA
jgi:hypothetical protein